MLKKTVVAGIIGCALSASSFVANAEDPPSRKQSGIDWVQFEPSELDVQDRWVVKVEENESSDRIWIAYVDLEKESGNRYLFVYNTNSQWCGSGGCHVQIFLEGEEIDTITPGDRLKLGKQYTRGMRNLQQLGIRTLVWNGSQYQRK